MYSFRSDAHTGENRCWPCTVTNVVIAIAIAGILYLFSPLLAAAFFGVGVLLIAFVGYLVPGTPYLTQRYFPKRILGWFGKQPPGIPDQMADDVDTDRDLEADVNRLVTAGALSVSDDDALALTSSFEDRWKGRIGSLREDERAQRETFAGIVGVDPSDVHFETIPETEAFSVRIGENNVSQWMSRAAFVADIAANESLSAIDPGWESLSLLDKHGLLMGLRQFLTTCPICDGALVEENETTESCCWSINAITSRCDECGDRLYVAA